MEDLKFRPLNKNEVEARVATVKEPSNGKKGGCQILLYKNARCDMAILDETVGAMNWQRVHKDYKGVMYAGVGIRNPETNEWVWKWDCGTESFSEPQKGEASDSFKRAATNWGIGRELYATPFIWFTGDMVNLTPGKNGKYTTNDKFEVEEFEVKDGVITYLKVVNTKTGKFFEHRFEVGKISQNQLNKLNAQLKKANYTKEKVDALKEGLEITTLNELSQAQYDSLMTRLESKINGN